MKPGKIVPRPVESRPQETPADAPVILIHGPRQCGKTTLARRVGRKPGYVLPFIAKVFFRAVASTPHRLAHDLTDRRREILQIIAAHGSVPLREILERISHPPVSVMACNDLYHLKRLELIVSKGYGRGAVWRLQKEGDL